MKTYRRIFQVANLLKERGQKLTVSNIVTASLFTTGGTLAREEHKIKMVIRHLKY